MNTALAIVNQGKEPRNIQNHLFIFGEAARAACVFPGTGDYELATELCRACYRSHGQMLALGEDFADHPDYYVAAKLGGQIIATIGLFVKKTGLLPLEKQYFAQALNVSVGDIELGRFSFHDSLKRYAKQAAARELISALAVSHLPGRHGRFFLEAKKQIIDFVHFCLGFNGSGLFYKHGDIEINYAAIPGSKRRYYSDNKKPCIWEVKTDTLKNFYRL